MQITICGGGNAAHTAAGLLSAREEHIVNIYLSIKDEAARWKVGLAEQGGVTVTGPDGTITGHPNEIDFDPSKVIPGTQILLLALPAYAHEAVLQEIAPFLERGTLIGALSARGSFDLCVRDALKNKADQATIFGLQSLPWACRIKAYGREATILGSKAFVDFATHPAEKATELAPYLREQLGIPLKPVANFLSLTLAGTGQLIHPGVMYGLFHDWNGESYQEAPLFYQGIDEATAEVLQSLSDEVQVVRQALTDRFPDLDLSAVRTLEEWLLHSYAEDIDDTSSLRTHFVTNRSYAGLKAPMRREAEGYVPDFQARYLYEDIPFGLLATRGIAELTGVSTPTMDAVIEWAQAQLDKSYLVRGKLMGHDLQNSRAPQRFGCFSMEEMIETIFSPI